MMWTRCLFRNTLSLRTSLTVRNLTSSSILGTRLCRVPRPRTWPLRISSPRHARFQSTIVHSKKGFPDKLLVYHGKVGKTVFIGVLKMGTMFFFIGTCVVIAPALSKDPDMPWWATPLAVLLGTVPMLAVGYATAPFVTFAHLHLPPHVRRSWERIVIYSKRLPPDAKLTISTMRFSTFSRTTQINVSDLRPMKAWYTAANICNPRTSFGLQSKAPWLLGGPVHQFYIGPQEKKVLRDEIWRNIMKKIQH